MAILNLFISYSTEVNSIGIGWQSGIDKYVFFTANKYDDNASLVHVKDYEKQGFIGDIYAENDLIHKYFNIFKWLNQAKKQ